MIKRLLKYYGFVLFLAGVSGIISCRRQEDYTKYVDVFIGTGGEGNTFPGAAVPFGMVQLSPDTRFTGGHSCGGYFYPDTTIIGFSHTHLSGVGEPEYRAILFMPGTGKIFLQPGTPGAPQTGYRSAFDHTSEQASPGYYSVVLKDYHIKAELTATSRCGFHRYTFPASDSSHLLIDLAYPGGAKELYIHKVSNTEIEGLRRSHGWAWDQWVYFVSCFSKPFQSFTIAVNDSLRKTGRKAAGKNIKAVITFSTVNGEEILVKTGISAVSMEGARKNLEKEIPGWDFEGVKKAASHAWNEELKKITVEGGLKNQRTIFYTSMYHACLAPDLYMDVDSLYRGIDHKVHKAHGFTNYTVFSLWDTFRGLHPLFTIIRQQRTLDFIRALLAKYDDGGRLPMWPLAGNYTDDMIGYHAVSVIADAYVKGIRNFDTEKAFTAMKQIADMNRLGLRYYKKTGFVPDDRQGESVSKTLEYCYDDWCIAQMAKEMGKEEDYKTFHQRAWFYRNVFDTTVNFMRPRKYDRSWRTPFDPLNNHGFTEGNAYQYLFVPHDLYGLKKLMGGDKVFSAWLDTLFTKSPDKADKATIGQYNQGNEPSHHLAYLYDYTGEPWKTQQRVHQILTQCYTYQPDGLAGNEDCGQMSAWYILGALGFYSVSPGQDIYAIGSPLFDKATVHLENGKEFVIEAKNVSGRNFYIQSATLNGKPLLHSYLKQDEIMDGGHLVFTMGTEPNKKWARKISERPYSGNGSPVVHLPYIQSGQKLFLHHTTLTLGCDTKGAEVYYTLNGSVPSSQSPHYISPIHVDRTTTLTMLSRKKGLMPSTPVSILLQKARFWAPVFIRYPARGLLYDYYERFFVTTDDLDKVSPVKSGTASSISLAEAQRKTYFGLRFSGFIKIPANGIYTFYLLSNDGSRLYIDGKELIENDGNHATIENWGKVALRAGPHNVLVKYFQCGGGSSLKLSWSGPGFTKTEVSPTRLFHSLKRKS